MTAAWGRDEAFVPVPGQAFQSKEDWIARAHITLTSHPEYHNTEHDGHSSGWRGNHFTALCYDQKGRRCRIGADFTRAETDDAYPIWWAWPDQIAGLLTSAAALLRAADAEITRLRSREDAAAHMAEALRRIERLAALVAHDLNMRVEGGKVAAVQQCSDVASAALAAWDASRGDG